MSGSNEAGPSSAKETKDLSAIEAEDEDDLSNLQRAWEMLEMSKVIYLKHLEADVPNKEAVELKLSDTYETLGEVSIENEDYPHAIEDLTTSLKLRQKLLPEDSRLIAETHYQVFQMSFRHSGTVPLVPISFVNFCLKIWLNSSLSGWSRG